VVAHELALIGERRCVPILIETLPEDVDRSGVMDCAGALATLSDARAVQPLIDLLAPGYREPRPRRPRGGWTHASVRRYYEDWRGARWRAALALGYFDDDRASDALRIGVDNSDVRVPCRAALFRRERDRMLLMPVPGHARGENPVEVRRVAAYLDDIAPDYSTRLLDLVEADAAESGSV
jgi:hypothetical protein